MFLIREGRRTERSPTWTCYIVTPKSCRPQANANTCLGHAGLTVYNTNMGMNFHWLCSFSTQNAHGRSQSEFWRTIIMQAMISSRDSATPAMICPTSVGTDQGYMYVSIVATNACKPTTVNGASLWSLHTVSSSFRLANSRISQTNALFPLMKLMMVPL